MNLKKFSLEWIERSLIDDLSVQPDKRTEGSQIQELRESIEATGVILPPVVMRNSKRPGRFIRLDGHRRDTVAELLGVERVQCLVLESEDGQDASAMFFIANCFTRPVSAGERINAWAKTPAKQRATALKHMRKAQAKQIDSVVGLLGEDLATELALDNRALASLGKCVRSISSWCEARGYDMPSKRRTAKWLIEFRALRLIDSVARNPTSKATEGVVNAIHEWRNYSGPRR